MRVNLLAFVLMLVACAMAQDRKEYHMFSRPGTLESALSVSVQSAARHEIGSLTPPGNAHPVSSCCC